jgi:uncharacterized delta-60 repeat protein
MRFLLLLAPVVVLTACPGATGPDGGTGTGGGTGGGTAYDSGYFPILPPGIEGQAQAVVPTGTGDVFAVGSGFADGGATSLLVARVKADRTLDPAWGTDGVALVDVENGSVGGAVLSSDTGFAALVDGENLYVVGTAQALVLPGEGQKVLLAKFLANGTLDTTFGNTGATTGVRLDGFTGTTASATAILKQPDGRLLVGGQVQGNFYVTRYLANGTADVSFSKTPGMGFGAVWGASGRAEETRSMVLDPDGKIVVFGGEAMSAARLLGDGQLDVGFGSSGFFSQPGARGSALWRETDGSYLAVGFNSFATDAGDRQLAVRFAKLTSGGQPDPAFGTGGQREVVLPGTNIGLSSIRGTARLPDGRVLLYITGLGETYLARFNADLTLDTGFLQDGALRPLGITLPLLQPAFIGGNHLAVTSDRFWVGDMTLVTVEPRGPTTKNFFEVVTAPF